MESKKDIRRDVLEQRNSISQKEWEEKSRAIYKRVVTHPFFLSADVIYCYLDYRNEVGTRAIIETAWEQNKKVAIPKVEDDEMQFYYIDCFSEVSKGYKGILEPTSIRIANAKNPLVILPGAAFDRKRNRIGYGKGFYDKYMKQNPSKHTIAIAFEFQLVESIPTEIHDFVPKVLITEEKIYDK